MKNLYRYKHGAEGSLVDHFRIFGCISYAHVPDKKRKKLKDKSLKYVFLVVSETSKAHKLYDPLTKKVVVSHDVIFDEKKTWTWEEKITIDQQIPVDLEKEQAEALNQPHYEPGESSSQTQQKDPVEEDYDHSQRNPKTRRRPTWMIDYEMDYDSSNSPYFAFFMDSDLIVYEEAVKEKKWREAMDSEIKSIEENKIWELTVQQTISMMAYEKCYRRLFIAFFVRRDSPCY